MLAVLWEIMTASETEQNTLRPPRHDPPPPPPPNHPCPSPLPSPKYDKRPCRCAKEYKHVTIHPKAEQPHRYSPASESVRLLLHKVYDRLSSPPYFHPSSTDLWALTKKNLCLDVDQKRVRCRWRDSVCRMGD